MGIVALILLLSSCHKNDREYRTGEIQSPVVTGHYELDDLGHIIRIVGTPNVQQGDAAEYSDAQFYITTFPNPSINGRYNIGVKGPENFSKKVWITAANKPNQNTQYGTTKAIAGSAPLIEVETTNNFITLDLRTFSAGYYRVYMQSAGGLYYDNLLLIK